MAVFSETIKLDDQVSAPAKQASSAVASAGQAMGGLSKSTLNAASAIQVGKETIGAAMSGIKNAFTSLAQGDVKGAIAGVTDAVAGIAKMLDLVVPGLGEAVSAIISIVGGMVGITVGLIKSGVEMAIEATQAKIAMIAMFDALGEGKITGEKVDDMLDGLSAKLGQTKDAMQPIVQKFMAMGITSQDALEKMTTAALSAKALVGGADSGAQAFEKLAKKIQLASETGQGLKIPIKGLGSLAEMGLTVDDVAKKMGVSAKDLAGQLKAGTADAGKFGDALQTALVEKGAGPLEAMSLGAGNLKAMLKQSIGDMFEDMQGPVTDFMKAIKDLFGIFGKSVESGKAMKAGIGGFFSTVLVQLTKVVPMAKHFLLDLIIYGLKAYIALKPIVKTIRDFAASKTGVMIIDALVMAFKAIGVVVLVVVGVLVTLGVILFTMSMAFGAVLGAIISVGAAIGEFIADGLRAIITAVVDVATSIYGFISGVLTALDEWSGGALTAAKNFVMGLVDGIANGAGMVIDAVKGLASSALGAFTSALGIASPSKVMVAMGGHVAAGTAEGIEAGTGDVHGAASGMATAAVKGASSPDGGASGGAAKSGASITVMVQIDGAGKSALEITEEMVATVFERFALQAGV